MNILFVLIPLSLVLMGVAVWALFWAIDSGQLDNLDEISRAVPGGDDEESGSRGTAAGAAPFSRRAARGSSTASHPH